MGRRKYRVIKSQEVSKEVSIVDLFSDTIAYNVVLLRDLNPIYNKSPEESNRAKILGVLSFLTAFVVVLLLFILLEDTNNVLHSFIYTSSIILIILGSIAIPITNILYGSKEPK